MIRPLSKHKKIFVPINIGLNLALVVAQSILSDASVMALWVNWVASAFLAGGVWDMVSRYRLGHTSAGMAVPLSWTFICVVLNFTLIHFPSFEPQWKCLLQEFCLLGIVMLAINTWQVTIATGRYMIIGLIIGVLSVIMPHTLAWVFMLPWAFYCLRSWSWRNWWSAITGVALGIWVAYCGLFFFIDEALADGLFARYAVLFDIASPDRADGFTLWHWLFIAAMALMLVSYAASGFFLNVGDSLRGHASLTLISSFSLAMTVLALLDLDHLSIYVGIMSIFLSIQVSVHHASLHSIVHEWWVIFSLAIFLAFGVLPLVIML